MTYVDGFLAPVLATSDEEAYRAFADKAAPIFREYGATRVVECWEDDVPDGKTTDFRRAVQLKEGEHVVFSWVEWPDKATRDAGMKKVMDDPRMNPGDPMPFDGPRMIYGGFRAIVDR
ncbi:DUF1428 domain-containing protein [Sphingomonas sp.]|uniref:DUF1428 domain-containing protein n=1 Tax=Sphingomonas sp. TaxID=28214 RepID=UPI003B001A0C